MRDERRVARKRLRLRRLLDRALRHGLLVDPEERLPRLPVEQVEPTGLARLRDARPQLAVDVHVEQHDRAGRVVVPDVVVDFLEVPPVLAGLRVERDDRASEEVVAGPFGAVQVRGCVSGGEVQEPEVRIDRGRLPDGRAAVLPRVVVGRPRVVTDLARAGNRVEAPQLLPRRPVERRDPTADPIFTSGDAGVDPAVVVERRARDRVPVLPARDLRRPDDLAGLLVERDELAVELADVHLAVAERHASARPAAADGRDLLIQLRPVLPFRRASARVDGEHVVGPGDRVDHAVVGDRLGLSRVLAAGARLEMDVPDPLQLSDVRGADLVERRVAVVRDRAAVRDPVLRRRAGELGGREGGGDRRASLPAAGSARVTRGAIATSAARDDQRDDANGENTSDRLGSRAPAQAPGLPGRRAHRPPPSRVLESPGRVATRGPRVITASGRHDLPLAGVVGLLLASMHERPATARGAGG